MVQRIVGDTREPSGEILQQRIREAAEATGSGYYSKTEADSRYSQLGHGHVASDLDGVKVSSGFPQDASGNYAVTLSYDPVTQQVTLTPTGSTFDIYVRGQKFTVTGTHTSVAHDAAAGQYFYYHDGSSFVWDTSPWPFDEAPICFVYWTGTDGVGYFELHTATRDPNLHRNLHYSQGTQLKTRGALAGYTLTTDSDAGVTFSIGATTILDEDIEYTLSALADAGPYTIWYRTTAGAWTFSEGNVLPFLYGTYPRWNNTATWTMVDGSPNYYLNYYVFATPALETQQQFVLIPGQAEYSSLAGAQAESLANLSYGDLPFQEIVPLYKITFGLKNSYGGTAKTRIEAVTTLVGDRVSISASPISNHNALTGLQGGAAGEYYHLTAAELAELQAVSSTYEPALGNPGTDGWVLSSTAAGVRSWISVAGGVSDHGALSGLADDDHTQYYNATRLAAYTGFDSRYYTEAEIDILLAGKEDNISLTASRAVVTDASGNLTVSLVTSTELGYVDGVTSSIQTQLNGKASTSHNHSGTYEPVLGNPATNGYVLSSTTGGTRSWVPNGGAFSGAYAYRSTNQVITNGTKTAVAYNNEVYDTDSYFTLNGSTMTAPSDGYYHVEAGQRWDTSTSGQRFIDIVANGIVVAEQFVVPAGTLNTALHCSATVYLTAGQTVYARAGLDNGSGDRSITPGSNRSTFLSIHKVG